MARDSGNSGGKMPPNRAAIDLTALLGVPPFTFLFGVQNIFYCAAIDPRQCYAHMIGLMLFHAAWTND